MFNVVRVIKHDEIKSKINLQEQYYVNLKMWLIARLKHVCASGVPQDGITNRADTIGALDSQDRDVSRYTEIISKFPVRPFGISRYNFVKF